MPEILTIEHYSYQGKNEGINLLISGAIHGNEVCGTIALRWLKEQIENGLVKVTKGKLTILPLCNPKAQEQDTRFFERNLNRHFYPKENPTIYEDKIINIIAPYYEATDVLLDLHSYHTEGKPFVFFRPGNEAEAEFSGMLGVSTFFYGFGDAYKKAGVATSEKESMGTTEYTRLNGGYGVTMECGLHSSPASVDAAKRAIMGVLKHLGIAEIDASLSSLIPEKHSISGGDFYRMNEVFYKKAEGVLEDIPHLQFVDKDQLLGTYNDGSTLNAPYSGYMIFPKHDARIGEEWFYLAEKTAQPK